MKKTYTSDEVVALYNQYQIYLVNTGDYEKYECDNPFDQWLKEKEQSEVPVKEKIKFYQEIWVTDVVNHQREWVKANFTGFNKVNKPIAVYKGHELIWDEYSLTDPNQ